MLDLDGPELLQFAMMFVEGALKKSQVSVQRSYFGQKYIDEYFDATARRS